MNGFYTEHVLTILYSEVNGTTIEHGWYYFICVLGNCCPLFLKGEQKKLIMGEMHLLQESSKSVRNMRKQEIDILHLTPTEIMNK